MLLHDLRVVLLTFLFRAIIILAVLGKSRNACRTFGVVYTGDRREQPADSESQSKATGTRGIMGE